VINWIEVGEEIFLHLNRIEAMPKKTILSEAEVEELKELIKAQDGSARELARAQAILLYEQKLDSEFIKSIVGMGRSAVFKWRGRYQKHGALALHDKQRKPKSLLTKNQIEVVVKMLQTTTPKTYGFKTDFWNAQILGMLIKTQYNVEYKSKKPLYLLFEQAKFTYHKPDKQYSKRNQEVIDQWVQEKAPIIKEYLADDNTVVLTGDEMVLSTQTTSQKVLLPVNTYPKVDISNERANYADPIKLDTRDLKKDWCIVKMEMGIL